MENMTNAATEVAMGGNASESVESVAAVATKVGELERKTQHDLYGAWCGEKLSINEQLVWAKDRANKYLTWLKNLVALKKALEKKLESVKADNAILLQELNEWA